MMKNQSFAVGSWSLVVGKPSCCGVFAFGQRPTTNDHRAFSMRIAYLDCFSGMSGDMFLGALVDAGVSAQTLEQTVAALNIGARLEISRVNRSGISATKVDVYVNGEKELPREEYWEKHRHEHEQRHGHEHHHAQKHASEHQPVALCEHNFSRAAEADDRSADTRTGVSAPHPRGLKEIREIIRKSAIRETANNTAIRIFEALGAAEAKIHNCNIEEVHFHEVGAVD